MKILLITSNRIGDAVLTTGVLGHLIAAHSGARVTVACGPLATPLFAPCPAVERVITMPKRRFAGHWFDLWRQVVGTRWDLLVDLRDSIVGRTVAARRRLILTSGAAKAVGAGVHKVEILAHLIGARPAPMPRLWLDGAARDAARALMGDEGMDSRPVLALAPTANWTGKEWPADRFVAAALALTGDDGPLSGGRVMVLAAPSERPRAAPVVDALARALGCERVIDVIGRTDAQTAGACLARAALLIGNDSGLMHIGAAVGTPTLGLFGPGFPEVYGPRGARTALVTSVETGDALRARVAREGAGAGGLMDGITVSAVVEAAAALLMDGGAEPG